MNKKSFGWTGYVIVGLSVILIVGAIIAANTHGPVEEKEEDDFGMIDSDDEEADAGEENEATDDEDREVEEEEIGADELPKTGVEGAEEFVY